MAISFSKSTSKLSHDNKLAIFNLEDKLTVGFYFKYFLHKRTGLMFDDEDFQQMINLIDNLQQ